jgi:hypothetical protein
MGAITVIALITFITAGVLMHFVTPADITKAGHDHSSIVAESSKALPTVISYVSEKYHSPVVAHLIDEVITIGSLTVITVTPLSAAFFYGMDTADAMALLFGFIVTIIASIVASVLANGVELKGPRPVILGVSIADLIVMSIYAYYWFGNSSTYLGITMNAETWGIVASPFIAGIVIYFVMRWYRLRKEGIDIRNSFREISPE